MSRSEVVKLTTPVQFDGREVREVTVRAPKVRDMKLVDRLDGADRAIRLNAELTGLPATVLEEMDLSDFNEIDMAAARLGKSPATTAT